MRDIYRIRNTWEPCSEWDEPNEIGQFVQRSWTQIMIVVFSFSRCFRKQRTNRSGCTEYWVRKFKPVKYMRKNRISKDIMSLTVASVTPLLKCFLFKVPWWLKRDICPVDVRTAEFKFNRYQLGGKPFCPLHTRFCFTSIVVENYSGGVIA